jgi:hypothetical protein
MTLLRLPLRGLCVRAGPITHARNLQGSAMVSLDVVWPSVALPRHAPQGARLADLPDAYYDACETTLRAPMRRCVGTTPERTRCREWST